MSSPPGDCWNNVMTFQLHKKSLTGNLSIAFSPVLGDSGFTIKIRGAVTGALLATSICITLAACSRDAPPPVQAEASTSEPVAAVTAPDIGAETVYINGRIYTVNAKQPWAEAVAIKDGKFLRVGSNNEISRAIVETTEVVDLQGAFAMPGIGDSHIHPALLMAETRGMIRSVLQWETDPGPVLTMCRNNYPFFS